jgi:hypothetical protein
MTLEVHPAFEHREWHDQHRQISSTFEPRIMQFDLKMVYRRHRAHAFLSNPAL